MKLPPICAASATVDITPEEQVELGCGQGDEASWLIGDRVEINFLALRLEADPPVVLVSADVLYVGPLLEEIIVQAFPDLPRERLFIAATHTHAAPMTDSTKPMLGRPDSQYMTTLPRRIEGAAAHLLEDSNYRAATLKVAEGRGNHSINRRRWKEGADGEPGYMGFAPNPKGPTDEAITVLEAIDEDGALLAFVWNYACHPVAYPRGKTISSHFPGVLRDYVRREQGRQVPVLFFQGFSGNTRPKFLVKYPELRSHVWHLVRFRLAAPSWQPSQFDHYADWADSLARSTLRIAKRARAIGVQEIDASRAEMVGDLFVSPLARPVVFQSIRLGARFGLVGVSAEPVAEYADAVRKEFPAESVMTVGCLDTPFGYAPIQSMIAERGYESERFLEHFELEKLNPDIEQHMMEGFRSVC